MERVMREISTIKNDVVITGSWVAKVNNKLERLPKDLDIVVTSLDGLETFGEIICGESTSPFAKDSKRCRIEGNEFMIDIWLKDELPEYDIIDGMKFETMESQKRHLNDILDSTDNKFLIDTVTEKLGVLC
jgi:hypothetical protein